MAQDILRGEEVLASLDLKLGFISLETGRPTPIPGNWLGILAEVHVSE